MVAQRARAEKKLGGSSAANDGAPPAARAAGGGWEDQKKRRNRVAQLPKLRDKVLADIEAAEARKAEIAAIYGDAGFFQRASHDQITALVEEQEALGPKIEALVAQWETIEREIEQG